MYVSPTLEPSSIPPPGPLNVAMSADEATRRTLLDLNPDLFPQVEDVRLTSAGLLAHSELYKVDFAQPSDLVYVVLASANDYVFLGPDYGGGELKRHPRGYVLAVYKAGTGEEVGAIPVSVTALPPNLGSFAAHATLVSAPSLTPRPTDPGITPAPTAPTPDHGAVPHGRPFRPQDADPAVLSALADYPLLPGNQWVYRDDNYSMGIWGGAVLTRTVRSAELLSPELLLVRMETEQTPVVKENPDLYTWRGPGSELEYLLLWRDELYRTSDPAKVLRWIDHFSAPGPIPTTAPCDFQTQQAGGCFSPDLLLPVRAGQSVSAPEVSQTWEWRTAPPRSMPVDLFDDCFEAFIIGSGATWRLYCRGVGEVRNEHISSCCYSGITQLTSYHLAASVAAPSSTATEPAQEDESN